jgi:hypothetical protein
VGPRAFFADTGDRAATAEGILIARKPQAFCPVRSECVLNIFRAFRAGWLGRAGKHPDLGCPLRMAAALRVPAYEKA